MKQKVRRSIQEKESKYLKVRKDQLEKGPEEEIRKDAKIKKKQINRKKGEKQSE